MTTQEETLRDLSRWIRRRLQVTSARQTGPSSKPNGYAVAEVPDWEMRQKLEAVEGALAIQPSEHDWSI